jgi:tetratricopeptide (TPR) repeat protein
VCDGLEQPLQAARAAEYTGDLEVAVGHYERALAGELSRVLRLEAMERMARCLRKAERYEESARWWRAIIAEPRQRRLTPYVELAKIAEHKLRDKAEALRAVEQARELVRRGLVMPGLPGSETGVDALERRWARLALTPRPAARSSRSSG